MAIDNFGSVLNTGAIILSWSLLVNRERHCPRNAAFVENSFEKNPERFPGIFPGSCVFKPEISPMVNHETILDAFYKRQGGMSSKFLESHWIMW